MVTTSRALNVGIVGLGGAGLGSVPAMVAMPNVNLIGATDANEKPMALFRERFGAKTYGSIEELVKDPEIDTVWIATPNVFHAPHAILAANSGKHVVVEKPMAISLEECLQMIEACEKNGVELICGGSRSYSIVVQKMRQIVKTGQLGKLHAMSTWAATDWMIRPRRPDEYDVQYGGGVGFRQAPHQVDSLRLIAGGMVKSVRGMTGQWMPVRNTAPGYLTAVMEYEDGTISTQIYNGYGFFIASELYDGPEFSGPNAGGLEERLDVRNQIIGGTRDELAAKLALRLGNRAPSNAPRRQGYGLLGDLGLIMICCDKGDVRQSPEGVYVYSTEGTTSVPLTEDRGNSRPELEELYNKVTQNKPILHSGRWGLATMEVCMAIMQSSREHREIQMRYQVPLPDWA